MYVEHVFPISELSFSLLDCTCFYKMQVHANFFVPKLSLALLKCVCGKCHLFYILMQGNTLCFCNGCKIRHVFQIRIWMVIYVHSTTFQLMPNCEIWLDWNNCWGKWRSLSWFIPRKSYDYHSNVFYYQSSWPFFFKPY